jgi:phosphoglycerate dehydrogenase-like enzyme
MGMRLLGMGAHMDAAKGSQLGFERLYAPGELLEMLPQADVVVMCVPHTPETENMIGQAAFEAMKDGVVFVNVSRGQTVDEPYLVKALESGKIGSAVLDVFATEPLPENSPIWDIPNVLVSPHSASTVASENAKITDIFCHNLRCYLDGKIDEMKNVLNKARMY